MRRYAAAIGDVTPDLYTLYTIDISGGDVVVV